MNDEVDSHARHAAIPSLSTRGWHMNNNVSVVRGTTPKFDVDELRRGYTDEGFCVIPELFPSELVAEAAAAAEAVAEGRTDTGMQPRIREREAGNGSQRLIKIAEPHNASRALRALITSPEPWRAIAAVTGARMLQVWAVDLFIKRPVSTGHANIGWHQDGPYATYWKGDIFTVWIALSEVSTDSSPLRYVPGSHRLGPVGKADLFHTDLDLAGAGLALPTGFTWTEVAAEVPAGGIAMHHRDTLHASGPNLSSQSRISLAVRIRTDRCELLSEARQVAHLTDGELAPVVYDRTSETDHAKA
ncbi:phytanoyl-CoA dioxygenase family protein [Streptomyces sp. NPDC001401]|uniref:phytanoyl-CoA dioxygenase family protein n=1 Tax=Streptomyces sp. NPDC001401 TaxID=3364570 RepID=UPI0036C5248F